MIYLRLLQTSSPIYSVIEESQVPISVFIRLEESPSEDLTMAEAYTRKPDLVYDILL